MLLGRQHPLGLPPTERLLVADLEAPCQAVFAVSLRIAARAGERHPVAVRHVRFDAFVLADPLHHEHGHWPARSAPSPPLAEIKATNRGRDRLLEISRP